MTKETANLKKDKNSKAAKKSSAGKSMKKTGGKDAGRESLAGELRDLIPQLDSEGLAFLVEQARVHLYNMQVEELNKAADALQSRGSLPGTVSARAAGRTGGPNAPKRAGEDFRIDGSESGSSYYLHYRNNESMFSRNEMIHLVKMINAKGTDLEIRERLYNWFDRERRDVFATVPIKDKFDNHLKTLAALLRKSFTIRSQD